MPAKKPTCAVVTAYADPSPAGLPVSIGVPFPQGRLKDASALVVTGPDGVKRPASGRPLVTWPDGSIRWCLLNFGARQAGSHRVDIASKPEKAKAAGIASRNGQFLVETDRVKLVINETGPGPFASLVCDGHEYLSKPGQLHFSVDDASTANEKTRSVTIVEDSEIRKRLRIEGGHYTSTGQRKLAYRLDVELWAGWPAVRLDYHYFHIEKNRPVEAVKRIAMDAEWGLEGKTERHFLQANYGLFYISRHVFNPDKVAVAADFERSDAHVENPAMLLDDVDYPFYLHAPLVGTHDWLGVRDSEHSVYLKMQDFTAAKPNRMVSEGSRLNLEMWPDTAETLELPQGRSRKQVFTLAFVKQGEVEGGSKTAKLSGAPNQAPQGVAAILQAPVHEGRATVDPSWLAACGEFGQDNVLPPGRHVRIENNLAGLMQLDMPETKFDIGDTESHYNSSYSYIIRDLVPPLKGAPDMPRRWPKQAPTQTYLDCHEPVWTNNEYDAIHAFANELMRTGRHDLWRTLRLTARHNIEVDFIHYSDHRWIHRATPAHSARHTTTGAYPSHFWTQGLLEYYCMSGDVDAREVAVALGDKTIENFSDPELRKVLWGFNREIGWTILLLVHLYDITREKRFKKLLDEMVDYIIGFDRDGYKGAVNLSAGNDRQSLNRQIVANFFGYASMVEGIDLYADVTGRKDVDKWLKKFAGDMFDAGRQAAAEGAMPGINFGIILSVGYERTKAKRFLGMIGLLLDTCYWNATGLNGGASMKPVASIYRGLTRLLGHAWRQGLLAAYEYPSVRKLK